MDEIQGSAVTAAEDSWDDITLDGLVDETDEEEAEESANAEEPEADQPTEEEAEQQPETESAEQEDSKETDQLFELKHLDETRTVNREEVITLAQKGMDYDRIRGRLDAAKDGIEWYEKNQTNIQWLEELAKEQNMTLTELVDNTRAQLMSTKTRQPLPVCQGIVANDRRAAELDAQQKALSAKDTAQAAQDTAREKMNADIQAFIAAYPEQARDPGALPKEVWDAVHKGETLLNAYRAWENQQLKAQLAKEKSDAERRTQEEKNKARSTGSQNTAGQRSDTDAFDAAWYDGD